MAIYGRVKKETNSLQDLEMVLLEDLGEEKILSTHMANGELTINVSKDDIVDLSHILCDAPALNFHTLTDITAVDYPEKEKRFEVVYHLLSLELNQRLRVKISVDENDAVSSVYEVWPNANWYEREIWDMFGITFNNHPDLRRLLTDYGFEGHPLRKDFPLSGHVQCRYDSEQARIVQEPVKLTQAFRSFDNVSPWVGMDINKPKENK